MLAGILSSTPRNIVDPGKSKKPTTSSEITLLGDLTQGGL